MCVKKKEDSQFYKSGINIEYIQNNVRKSLVREYTYLRKLKGLTQAEVAERSRNFENKYIKIRKWGI